MKAELKHGWAARDQGRIIYEPVEAFERDAPASGQTASGYGSKIPTRWMIRLGFH